MPISDQDHDLSDQFYTRVDDEQYDELSNLVGERIVYAAVWEESVADTLSDVETTPDGLAVDLDLYLADGVYFELYGVTSYSGPDEPPLDDAVDVEARLRRLIDNEGVLGEIAVDEEDALVLVLNMGEEPALYLQVGAWILVEWEELPDDRNP